MNTKKWSDIRNLIQDRIRSSAFVSDNIEPIRRAFNSALDRMNAGDIGIPNTLGVAFNFQLEEKDISYSTTTGHDYSFTTLGITEATFKFPSDHGLRIDSDEDVYFTHRTPEYWYRRHGVEGSSEKMFCLEYNGNTLTLKINHDATETLNFWFYTNAMVLDNGGSTRRAYIDGDSDDDTLLIPDRFVNVALDFTMGELYGQKAGYTSPDAQYFLNEGRKGLRGMINSIGKYEIKPVENIKIRSEWRQGTNRISRT